MFILTIIPFVFGYFVASRILRVREIIALVALSLALGIAGMLFFVNPLFYFLPLPLDLYITLIIMCIISIILWRMPIPRIKYEPIKKGHLIVLITSLLIITIFANYLQVSQLDDDYWMHTPLMGLYLTGHFPPSHPFFPHISLPGHYGRDLSICAFSVLNGGDFLATCWKLTTLIQPLIFLLIFVWVREMTGRDLYGIYSAVFVFFGVNMGTRTGLFDMIQNNNSFVYLHLFLIIYIFFKVLSEYKISLIILCVCALGLYPVVYESHYGLLLISFAIISLYMAFKEGRFEKKPLITCLIILVMTLPIAFCEGGFFSARLKSAPLNGQGETMYERSNTQNVKMTFPKKELLKIYLGPGKYQRISIVYPIIFPGFDYVALSTGYKYAHIWSPSFLILVWLPFYLAPLTIFLLLKKKSIPGIFLWVFGFTSFLVPALVDFGPVFEEEYFRWEAAAGVGFAGALGIVVAIASEYLGSLSSLSSAKRKAAWTLIIIFVCFNLIGALSYFNAMLINYERFFLKIDKPNNVSASYFGLPDPLRLLITKKRGFDEIDIDACRFLRPFICSDDTVLRNFQERFSLDLEVESTISGLTGAFMLGHTFPPYEEELRHSPFRMNMRARAFFNTGDTALLGDLGAHWLYIDPRRLSPCVLEKIARDSALRPVYEESGATGEKRMIFEYRSWQKAIPLQDPKFPENTETFDGLRIKKVDLPEDLREHEFYYGKIVILNEKEVSLPVDMHITYRWLISGKKEQASVFDRIEMPLPLKPGPGEEKTSEFYCVTPFGEGAYDMEFYCIRGEKVWQLQMDEGAGTFKISAQKRITYEE